MVCVVFRSSYPVCLLQRQRVNPWDGWLRRPTWVRSWATSVSVIHCWPSDGDPVVRPTTAFVRWWYPDYGFFQPGASHATSCLESRMSECFSAVADWMSSNRLQLNATKMEILWCTSSRRGVDNISFPKISSLSVTIKLHQSCLFATLAFIWTPIYPCEHMSSELLLAALLFFVALKVFDGPWLNQCRGFSAVTSWLR